MAKIIDAEKKIIAGENFDEVYELQSSMNESLILKILKDSGLEHIQLLVPQDPYTPRTSDFDVYYNGKCHKSICNQAAEDIGIDKKTLDEYLSSLKNEVSDGKFAEIEKSIEEYVKAVYKNLYTLDFNMTANGERVPKI